MAWEMQTLAAVLLVLRCNIRALKRRVRGFIQDKPRWRCDMLLMNNRCHELPQEAGGRVREPESDQPAAIVQRRLGDLHGTITLRQLRLAQKIATEPRPVLHNGSGQKADRGGSLSVGAVAAFLATNAVHTHVKGAMISRLPLVLGHLRANRPANGNLE